MEKQETKFEIITTVPGFVTCADIISKLREKYDGAVYDVSTPTGMAKAVFARKELRDARIALDKKKPEVKREALDYCAKVESDYKAIRAAVEEYENIPDAVIKAKEAEQEAIKVEKARLAAEAQKVLDDKIIQIGKLPLTCIGKTIPEIQDLLARLEPHPIGAEFTGESRNRAEAAKTEALEAIREMLAGMVRAEEIAAQVKAEQEAEASRLESERIEREAAEKIQREAMPAQQAELDEQKRLQDIENERIKEEVAVSAAKFAAERAAFEAQQAGARKAQEVIDQIAREKEEAELAGKLMKEQIEREEAARIQKEAAVEAEKKAALAEKERLAAEKLRKAAEKKQLLAEAKCADAATAFKKILDICQDEDLSDKEARDMIALVSEGNL
jgi:hypothetical protein